MRFNEIAFPKLGIDVLLDPTAFTIFGLSIRWYAICIAVGVILAYIYAIPRLRKNGLDDDKAFNCVFLGFIGAIIGARVYYVLMTMDDYNWTLSSIFSIRTGGLAIYGGIIGAVLFGAIGARIWKVRFIPLLDIAAPSFLIGQCIGRWGNFFNQEAFGSNTDLPWGMTGGRIAYFLGTNAEAIFLRSGVVVDPNAPVHPCFLYESLWCLVGFLLIHFIFSKLRTFDGELILIYAAWYGFGRAAIETFRTDSLMIGSIRVSQLLGIITAVIAVVLIVILSVRAKRKQIPLYKDTEAAHAVIAACEERDNIAREKRAEKKATREKATELEEHEKLIIDDEETDDENTTEGDENHVS